MDYFMLIAGLILTLAAALQLIFSRKQENNFAGVLQEKIDRPMQTDLIALAGLLESLKENLREMEEKKQMLQYLLTQQKKQQEALEGRLQQLEALLLQLQRQPETAHPMQQGTEKRLNSRRQQVYQLYDQGLSVPEVASRLQLGRGEVELILGWRRAKA